LLSDAMTNPASKFRAMYLQHCEACALACVPAPTPEEWTELLDERLGARINLMPKNTQERIRRKKT